MDVYGGVGMSDLHYLALQAWSESSSEGVLMFDAGGTLHFINPHLRELFRLTGTPRTVDALARQAGRTLPELRSLLSAAVDARQVEWGNIRLQQYPIQRLVWQLIPLVDKDEYAGALIVFREAAAPGQLEAANQSFLSMVSHDFRTPLSTILGFAELLHNNRGRLSEAEQSEFLGHIINNANDLSQYTQIALDIMFLEANVQSFEMETVYLNRLVKHWLADARHRFPVEQIVFHNGVADEPQASVAPSALHRILNILVEFALAECPPDEAVDIRLDYDEQQAHLVIDHHAPELNSDEAAMLFQLMNPRDLSEAARPHLHRMQLYVACLLAERQHGQLTLRDNKNHQYQFDLAMPLS